MKDVNIPQCTRRQLTMILLALIMILVSIFAFMTEYKHDILIRYEVLLRSISTVGILFFGLILVFLVFRLIRSEAILIINEYGFTDNSTLASLGFVSWEYVEKIYLISVLGLEFIAVETDKSFVTDNTKKVWVLAGANNSAGFATININLQSSNAKTKDVMSIMQEYLDAYRTGQNS